MIDQIKEINIFLSYTRTDGANVKGLYQKLADAGYKPWMDIEDIVAGEIWQDAIIKAIRRATFIIICLSKESVNRRGIIQIGIKEALEIWRQKLASDIFIIPIKLEACEAPDDLAKFQWIDLFEERDYQKLFRAIRIGLDRLGYVQKVKLRSQPLHISEQYIRKMLQEKDLFDSRLYSSGKGAKRQYEIIDHNGQH